MKRPEKHIFETVLQIQERNSEERAFIVVIEIVTQSAIQQRTQEKDRNAVDEHCETEENDRCFDEFLIETEGEHMRKVATQIERKLLHVAIKEQQKCKQPKIEFSQQPRNRVCE